MSGGSRHGLALGTSLAVHGVVLAIALIDILPDHLDIDIELEFDDITEIDLIDPDQIQSEYPVPEPEKPAEPVEPVPETPEPETPEPEPETPEPVPEEPGVKRDLGKKKSQVGQLGPPNATYHVLLVPKTVRKLPYAKLAMSVMGPLPDFHFLVEQGGFDPLRDFDHILIASPNLRKVTQTFLAVDYKMSREEVMKKLEKASATEGEEIDWIEEGDYIRGNPKPIDGTRDFDPRVFVLLPQKVAVYVRPEFLKGIMSEEVSDAKTAGNFVAKLTKLKKYSRRIPTAGLQFVAKDLQRVLKKAKGLPFPIPSDIEFTVEAQTDPELLIRVGFASVVDAKIFVKWFDGAFRKIIDDNLTLKIMLGSLIDQLETERSGKDVKIWGELERDQVELLLQTIQSKVEQFQTKQNEKNAAKKKKILAKEAAEASKPKAPPGFSRGGAPK